VSLIRGLFAASTRVEAAVANPGTVDSVVACTAPAVALILAVVAIKPGLAYASPVLDHA